MTTRISTDIAEAAAIWQAGGLVAFGTETVYGLGACASNATAVARVFEVKQRPRFDPLIVHVADHDGVRPLVEHWSDEAQQLAERFWPGPLTLVLPKTSAVDDLVTAGLPTVAIRIPDHPQALQLLKAADMPIAAPSANRFGQLSPTCAAHVAEQLGEKIDLILDGGPCRVGVESTVLQLGEDGPILLRPGGVAVEELEPLIGPVQTLAEAEHPAPQVSPGRMPEHYAPRTPLSVIPDFNNLPAEKRIGLLTLQPVAETAAFAAVEVLSPRGDLREAAAGFFSALYRLDASHLDLIVALPCPDTGLGRALNDRLNRATHS